MASGKSVVIGDREWKVRNLNVRTFRNGDPVPLVTSMEAWAEAGEKMLPACCFFEHNWWKSWGYWWTSTGNDEISAWWRNLHASVSLVYRESFLKGYGFSVRCIKDTAVGLIPISK
jgi:hypothetical protein